MNLARLPHLLDKKTCHCRVIVETPKGRRNKFNYDPELEAFTLGGLLPGGLHFPYDFGFVPSTLGDDGDPVDLMLLMDEPAHVGCIVDVRIIGVIEAEQIEDGKKTVNNRLIGVAVHSYNHEAVTNVSQIHPSTMAQVCEFFVTYNKGRGKKFVVKGVHGPKRALKLVAEGSKKFESQ